MPEIIAAEELPKKLVEFKDVWYAVAQKCEGLSEYKSGLDEGFKNSLIELKADGNALGELLDGISIATQHHIPRTRDKVEELRAPMMTILRELLGAIDADIRDLTRYQELSPKLEEMIKNLHALQVRHEDLKKHATRTCDQYSKTKEEHEQKINNIKEATDRALSKIKQKFTSEISSMFEGYQIVTKGRREEVDIGLLLERLIQDPNYYQKVDVVHKGLFGKKISDIETRLVLLQYKAEEVTKAIVPIIEEEKRRVEKFEPEEKRIQELEIQCRELRDEEKSMSAKRESLEKEVNELKGENEGIRERFTNYNQLLSLVDSYVRKFGETTSIRKEISDLIEASMEAYEPVETDVEKRELKAQVKFLKDKTIILIKEKGELQKTLKGVKKELGERKEKVEDLSNNLEKRKSDVARLKGEVSNLKDVKGELEENLKGIEQELDEKVEHIETLEGRVATLEESEEHLQSNLEETEERLKGKTSELLTAQEELDDRGKRLVDLGDNYDALKTRYKEVGSELAVIKAKADGLEKKLRQTMKEKDILDRNLEGRDRSLKTASRELERAARKYENSQKEISRYKEKVAEEKKRYSELKSRHEKMGSELRVVKAEVAKLGREIASRMKLRPVVEKKGRKRKERGKGKETGEEEVIVEEKISALRKKM
ncbi:MAG: hypothetical protein V3T58_01855 [Candidatus Hydrothermarchaeales archaeon]